MSGIGKLEALFRDELATDRDGKGNIEERLLIAYLCQRGYQDPKGCATYEAIPSLTPCPPAPNMVYS